MVKIFNFMLCIFYNEHLLIQGNMWPQDIDTQDTQDTD